MIRLIDLSHDVWGMFDGEALSTFHQDISTELCLEWFICHIMCQECLIMNRFLHSITILQPNSTQNDWFFTWCVRKVRWWSVVYIPLGYFNGTLLRMIDLSHNVSGMFDREAFSTCDHDTSTELCSEWLICHIMCPECSMVKHCLYSMTIFQQNSYENDWLVTWCVRNVRWWSVI